MTSKQRNHSVYPIKAATYARRVDKFLFSDRYDLANWKYLFQKLPLRFDLRSTGLYGDVIDQGNIESSIGISLVNGCLEYEVKNSHKGSVPLSPLYVYQRDRQSIFSDPRQTTTGFIQALRILKSKGCSPLSLDEYSYQNFSRFPLVEVDAIASIYRTRKAFKVSGIKQAKHCLASGHPIATLIKVYSNVFDVFVYRTGEIPLPQPEDAPLGHHAITLVGYDDSVGAFIIRNSWSKSWGEYGYGYLPYDVFKKIAVASYTLRI